MYHPLSIYDDDTLGYGGGSNSVQGGLGGGFGGGGVASGGATGTIRGIGGAALGGVSLRDVIVDVVVNPASWIGVVFPPYGIYQHASIASKINQTLTGEGWIVHSVSDLGSVVGRTFRIKLSVESRYNDSTVTRNISSDLGKVASVQSVKILSSSASYSDPSGNATGGGRVTANDSSSFFGGGGGGLDLSTFAIGGLSGGVVVGLIALVVLLKE